MATNSHCAATVISIGSRAISGTGASARIRIDCAAATGFCGTEPGVDRLRQVSTANLASLMFSSRACSL